jgi:hypothetical protein
MSQAYTPGLLVSEQTLHRARRLLPLAGDVKVTMGQHVGVQDIVAETFMPGMVTPLNLANALAVPPGEVPSIMLKKTGETIMPGDILARTKGIFGYFKKDYVSKIQGTIESISKITGQIIIRHEPIPIQVKAYLQGTVVEIVPREGVVIEAPVCMIQGIFGIGGETFGTIRLVSDDADQTLKPERITPDMKHQVIIGGARITRESVSRAIEVGVAAIVSGGIDDHDLKEILGYDLGVAVTGTETLGITLIITEGFGDISMAKRTYDIFKRHAGELASVNGATQIRAGVMRPEIIIPLDKSKITQSKLTEAVGGGILAVGSQVRMIRDPYFGMLGTIQKLPSEPQVLGSGSKARVLEVKTMQGETILVPRANVEIIGGAV